MIPQSSILLCYPSHTQKPSIILTYLVNLNVVHNPYLVQEISDPSGVFMQGTNLLSYYWYNVVLL